MKKAKVRRRETTVYETFDLDDNAESDGGGSDENGDDDDQEAHEEDDDDGEEDGDDDDDYGDQDSCASDASLPEPDENYLSGGVCE